MGIELFKAIGLSDAKAKDTVKNANQSKSLQEAIGFAKDTSKEINPAQGMLLYHVASKTKPQIKHHLGFLASYVAENKLDTELRVNAGLEFLMQNANSKEVDTKSFDQACGVGIVVTPEEIEKAVEVVLSGNMNEIEEKRYRFPVGLLMAEVRKALPWADGKAIKSEFDVQILDMLGPKTEADLAPPPKKEKKPKEAKKDDKKDNKNQKKTADESEEEGAATIAELMKNKVHFHKPGENYKTDGYTIDDTTMDRLAAHLK